MKLARIDKTHKGDLCKIEHTLEDWDPLTVDAQFVVRVCLERAHVARVKARDFDSDDNVRSVRTLGKQVRVVCRRRETWQRIAPSRSPV
jgi:hypothetical protein